MGAALEREGAFAIPQATEAELQESLDYASRYYLGLSSKEFLRRWEAKEISEDDPRAEHVLYVFNFIRSAKGEAKL